MKRNVARDIWRAVVVAGAMLGTSACTTVPSAEGTEPAAISDGEADGIDDDRLGGDEQATKKKKPKKKLADAAPPPPDAAPADAAVPDARPRTEKREPRGRGFVLG